jgi:uncharacterized membrane protein YcaP (DUF421 family)
VDTVIRAVAIYLFLLLVFRISGKRALSEVTTFDFVLLIIISEATTQGLVGEDFSLINTFILIITLLGTDIVLSYLKQHSKSAEKVLDSVSLLLIDDGRLLRERMAREHVDEADILDAARKHQGLARLDQIRYAILEKNGGITVVPKEQG